jgi:putative two-component system response regulator
MKHLLFVDDEIKVLDALRRMLRAKRELWDCHFATGVDEALETIAAFELDAIISDVNMPGKTGLDLLRIVKADERTKLVPMLMLTGNTDVNIKREALELGATDFLNKPFDFAELTARLQNVLALKGFQDEIRAHNADLEQKVADRTFQLEQSRRDIILRLAKAAETRDADTGNHIVRVGLVAKLLSRGLGFDREFQEKMMLTAPLHDVGKIGIEDEILRKPGPLTIEERLRMQEHCRLGAEILTEDLGPLFERFGELGQAAPCNDLLAVAARIAQHHHERWDGKGYPNGLSGEDIPIEARIVAVADVYDALRSRRPYKEDFGPDETLDVISSGAAKHFDPQIVSVFVEMFDRIEELVADLREADVFDARLEAA